MSSRPTGEPGGGAPRAGPPADSSFRELGRSLRGSAAPWLYTAVLLLVLGAFLFGVRSVLSPIVLYLLFLYVVWPLVGSRVHVRLVAATSVLMLLWLFTATGLLLAPFLLALLFAYILGPVVDRLQGWRLPRPAAIGLLCLPLIGILALIVFVVAPAVGHQVSQLIANVPTYVAVLERWIGRLRAWVIGLDIRGLNERTIPQLREIDAQAVARYLRLQQSELASGAVGAVLGLGRGIGTVLTVLGYLVLTPILTYYLLRDWNRLRERLAELIPRESVESVLGFVRDYDHLLSRYLRGQLLLAVIVGLFIGLGFWIAGLPYALLVGLVAGVFNVVPYLGFAVSIVVALLIALFSGHIVASLVKVAVVYGLEQVLEGALGPYIVGESVGLHPVWVILALTVFGFFFGFVGLLLAVPLAVLLKLVVVRALRRYRASSFYALEESEPGG